jgi:DNA-binding CsgD family transcriptional regulator
LGVSKLDGKYPEIVSLREQGYIYKEIADILGCSHTLLRTFVKKNKAYGRQN